MTVADLIAQLEQLQQDTPLSIWQSGDYGVYEVHGVEVVSTGGDTLVIELI